jgi:hypothetical protein
MYMYVYLLIAARQRICKIPHTVVGKRLDKNVTAATNTQATIEELDASFSLWYVSYQWKEAISSSQNFLLITSQATRCYTQYGHNMNFHRRSGGPVNCCWPSPVRSFLFPIPPGHMTVFYFLLPPPRKLCVSCRVVTVSFTMASFNSPFITTSLFNSAIEKVAVAAQIFIQDVLGSNLGRDTRHPEWDITWVSLHSLNKFWDSTDSLQLCLNSSYNLTKWKRKVNSRPYLSCRAGRDVEFTRFNENEIEELWHVSCLLFNCFRKPNLSTALQPFVGSWPLFGMTPWVGDQPVAWLLPTHRTTGTE